MKLLQHCTMQTLPHTCGLPLPQSAPARQAAPEAELPWERTPGKAVPEDEQDARQHHAIRRTWTPTLETRSHGEQWLEDGPERVSDEVGSHVRTLCPFRSQSARLAT